MKQPGRYAVALFALLLTFFVARVALLQTSWDANQNWEEVVFIFSATELTEAGPSALFDHQDDLNHGASVLMIAALVPWFQFFEANLVSLKSFVILWSAMTLLVFVALLARHVSATAALAFGVLFVGFSPTLARINITAVGSHPEALLFCGSALFAYFEVVERSRRAEPIRGFDFALGLASGAALWCSYTSLTFVVPLALSFLLFHRKPAGIARTILGGVVGLLPWIFQNLWLRPHGALYWRNRVGSRAQEVQTVFERVSVTVAELGSSFGMPPGAGIVLLIIAIGATTALLVRHLAKGPPGNRGPVSGRIALPILLTPLVGFTLLVAVDLPSYGPANFYYYRFYVQMQVSLFVVLGLIAHLTLPRTLRGVSVTTLAAIVASVCIQAPIYGTGNNYVPNPSTERLAGCSVFGIAEKDRASDIATAIAQLETLPDELCRIRAFNGLGLSMVEGFEDAQQQESALLAIADPRLRWATCGGIYLGSRRLAKGNATVAITWKSLKPHCDEVRPEPALAGHDRPTHIIMVVIDTLRPDHLGHHGYDRDTSPFLDTVAAQGVLFENARSNSSYTRESVAALMSGVLPSRGGAIGWDAHPLEQTPTLAERMRAAGYTTGFLSNTTMLKHPRFTAGFEEARHLPAHMHMSGRGAELSQEAIRYLEQNKNDKTFLYLHYLDPHGPYVPAKRYDDRFSRERPEKSVRLYREVRPELQDLLSEGFGAGEIRFEDMVARYDAEIAATDDALKMLFKALIRFGISSDTLVVVTSDHGEEFLEHGFVEHAWTLYDESIRIPLIFWSPGRLAPARVGATVSLVDVAPTVLELAGIAFDASLLDGRTLFAETRAGLIPTGDSRTTIAETLIQERNLVRTIIDGDLKYHAAIEWLDQREMSYAAGHAQDLQKARAADPIDVWKSATHEEVYDLSADPGERRNLTGTIAADRLKRLRDVLETYLHSSQEAAEARGHLPETTRDLTPEERDQLRALGYL